MSNEDQALAKKLRASLKKDPALTVDELAEEHEVSHGDVVRVLDEYAVDGDSFKHAGAGRGEGWTA